MKTTLPTKVPISLFYRDPIECLQVILHNPLIQDVIEYSPFRIFETAQKLVRVYTEWLSGDAAWNIQVR